ncbi:MAG: hypothetical protein Q8Q14_09315 [Gemmatimonadales bacterium]|nr:hypothetical protein [Gemmatimonadales bacterium]
MAPLWTLLTVVLLQITGTSGPTLTQIRADAQTSPASYGLGTAAAQNVGVAVGDVCQFVDVGGVVALPAVSGANLVGLPVPAGAQPLDDTLTAFSGGACVADALLYCDGADTVAAAALTAAGRALLDDATAGDQRTTLGLGAAALLDAAGGVGDVITWAVGPAYPAGGGAAITGVTDAGALRAANNLSDVGDVATARGNLGAAEAAALGALATGADAGDVPYTPAVGADWPDPDPVDAAGGLDGLAGRVTTLESAATDAADVTYTPADLNDWTGAADPGDADNAIDQLADRAATLEGVSSQPLDGTLTALAGATWAAGTQVLSLTAVDTVSLLTVGTAANNIVQLDGAGLLPAVDGSALLNLPGGGGGWDWTTEAAEDLDVPSVDQLGGAVDIAKWTDIADAVDGWGGTTLLDGFSAPASMGGKAIVGVASTVSVNGRGFAMPSVAGDFIYAVRLGLDTDGVRPALSLTSGVQAVFVDGTDVTAATWYGTGIYLPANSWSSSVVRSLQGGNWNALSTAHGSSTISYEVRNSIDVFLVRSGTTLNSYAMIPGGPPRFIDTWTVSANAGLIGVRVVNNTTSLTSRGYLFAFARISTLPGR